jgi:alpha-1,2-mannosyltransferase
VKSLWRYAAWKNRIQIIFPPCRITDLVESGSVDRPRQQVVVSIGQFRPEKDHVLQLEAMEVLRQLHPDCACKLVLIGSCRGDDDMARLHFLQAETRRRHLDESVAFVVNQPYSVLQEWLQKASVGIHTVRIIPCCVSSTSNEYHGSLTVRWCRYPFVRCGTSILELV